MEPQGRLEFDFLKREGAESSENQFTNSVEDKIYAREKRLLSRDMAADLQNSKGRFGESTWQLKVCTKRAI